MAEPVGDTNRDYCLADPELIGVAPFDCGQVSGVYLYYGNIGLGISAYHTAAELSLVVKSDSYLICIPDNVVIGNDVPVPSDDYARAEICYVSFPWLLKTP